MLKRQRLQAIGVLDNSRRSLIQRLLGSINPGSARPALQYVDASTRWAWVPLGGEYWARWILGALASGMWELSAVRSYSVLDAVNDDDASLNYSSGWGANSAATSLGGSYQLASSAASVSFDVSGASDIYIVVLKSPNGGIASVTIDGGTDLVSELPLIGDVRQLDTYAAVTENNVRVPIAKGLDTAQTYTVAFAYTGLANPAAGAASVRFEGYGVPATDLTAAGTQIGNAKKTALTMGGVSSAYAYAILYTPSGATTGEWTGSIHGNEVHGAATWEDGNGSPVTVDAVTPFATADEIVMEQTATSRHSETGATDHANVTYRLTFNAGKLRIYHHRTWLTAANIAKAYPCMYPLNANMVTGTVDDDVSYDLTNNNDSMHGNAQKQVAALWHSSGWAAWLRLPDLVGVNDWTNSVDYLWIEDRSNVTINKIYADREQNTVVNVNDEWESTADYYVGYLGSLAAVP